MKPIYLDYAASTPLDPRVLHAMHDFLQSEGGIGNPSSTHHYGQAAKIAIEKARSQLANLVSAQPSEIIWTSGATESINLALKSLAKTYPQRGRHIITLQTEHPAVLEVCGFLQKKDFDITYLKPKPDGLLDWQEFVDAFREDTLLVSIAHVNNETGVIQDIQRIAEFCQEKKVFCHIDAAQSLAKLPINLQQIPIDLMSFSAHKCYGPKGIGALYLREKSKMRLNPLLHGGGQERGLRSGTLASHQIVGFGEVCLLLQKELAEETSRIKNLRDRLIRSLADLPSLHLNSSQKHSVPHILNFSVEGVEGESLLFALDQIAISSSSACTSATIEPSHVLLAMGLNPELAHASLRISLGRFTTEQEIDIAIKLLQTKIEWLRNISGIWRG